MSGMWLKYDAFVRTDGLWPLIYREFWIAAGSIDTRRGERTSPTARFQPNGHEADWTFGCEAGSEHVLAARW